MRRPLTALLVVVLALCATPHWPAAADVVRWSVAPADSDGPDGRISLRHVIEPGDSVRDAIAVANLGDAPATFEVRAGDGILGADGAFDIATGDPTGPGRWLRVGGLDDGTLTLRAGETRVLPVAIDVPADATPGDAPAGIVVGQTREAGGGSVSHRIGVRTHLQVAGELTPRLEITELTTRYHPSWIPFRPGRLEVTYRATNAGNVRLGVAAQTTARGPFGWGAGAATERIEELLPGGSAEVTTEVRSWPLVRVAGTAELTGLAVGEDTLPATPVVTLTAGEFAPPWIELLLLLLVIALLLRRRERLRRSHEAPAPTRSPVAVG